MKTPVPPMPPEGAVDLVVDAPFAATPQQIEFSARLVDAAGERRLWFRFPADDAPMLTRRADPFVIATLVYAMDRYKRMNIHGAVSPGLLANLADFQSAYQAFHRGRPVPPMELQASSTAEEFRPARTPRGISAFSGGVDSCFTVYRHTPLSSLQPKRLLSGSLMMHGFDIPLEQRETFLRAAARSRHLTDDAGLALHLGATNLRSLPVKWEDIYATAVAACLAFYQPAYSYGLLPSFQDWSHTKFNYGSSPLTDPMLSSLSFPIVHDGTSFGRIQKLELLARWPMAMRHLRVCWQGAEMDRNCCRCEKCVRTMLMLELVGVSQADAFPLPVDPSAIERLVIKGPNALEEQIYLLTEAKRRGLQAPWVPAVARTISRNRRRQRLWQAGKALKDFVPAAMQDGFRSAANRILWRSRARTHSRAAAPVNGTKAHVH